MSGGRGVQLDNGETIFTTSRGWGMKGLWGLLVVSAIVISLACASPVLAQGGAGAAQLNGTVTDPSGGSVANAAITLRNTDTNITYTSTSNERGYYVIANLTPGNYELKV